MTLHLVDEPPPPINKKIWRSFFITDVAEILSGRDINTADQVAGKIPYISSSSINNGIYNFVENENETLEENCISVNRTGSVGYAFYHPYEALYSNNVRKLRPRVANDYVSFFIAHQITAQRGKYNYGYILGTERLKRQKIQLPVDESGAPDFNYMENYVRAVEEKILERYRDFVKEMDAAPVAPLGEKIWRAFRLLDYFDFIKGDQNDMSTLEAGDLPLVSAKDNNNGYKGFVTKNGKKIYRGDCLTLNNDGSGAGIAYYQPVDFLLDTHVTALYPKMEMSRETMLFISRSIKLQREKKFAFGYTVTNKRLSLLNINLPVDESGAPDFEYMEAFVKNIVAKKYRKYLEYIGG